MKLIGTIRTTETTTIEVEGDNYAAAKAALETQVPDGFQLLSIRKTD